MQKKIFPMLLFSIITVFIVISCANKPQPKTYYMVDTLKCIGCGVCVDSCQFNAITLDTITWKAHIDTTKCTSCGVCQRVCRYQAIKDTVR